MKMTHPDTDLEVEVPDGLISSYVSQGWRPASSDAPAGNASLDLWRDYARSKGFTDEDLDGKTRDDLRAALS